MYARTWATALVGLMAMTGAGAPAQAQVSGRVIFEEGPIGVDIVFGTRAPVVVEHRDAPRYEHRARHGSRRPVRWQHGMSIVELERYLIWIEAEYRYFKDLHPEDAYYLYGWREWELVRYREWLKEERKFLRKQWKGDWEHDGWDDDRGRGRGEWSRGRGRGGGPPPWARGRGR